MWDTECTVSTSSRSGQRPPGAKQTSRISRDNRKVDRRQYFHQSSIITGHTQDYVSSKFRYRKTTQCNELSKDTHVIKIATFRFFNTYVNSTCNCISYELYKYALSWYTLYEQYQWIATQVQLVSHVLPSNQIYPRYKWKS